MGFRTVWFSVFHFATTIRCFYGSWIVTLVCCRLPPRQWDDGGMLGGGGGGYTDPTISAA